MPLLIKNRVTGNIEEELIYGGSTLTFLYHKNPLSFLLSRLFAYCPFLSQLYGFFQKTRASQKKILPFIKKYSIDPGEFIKRPEDFASFNDFFCRHLKPEARPLAGDQKTALIPTDGRFLFYPKIEEREGFIVKGKKFSLEKLLQDPQLALEYKEGCMVLGRLAPVDYHRFHFPLDCTPGECRPIHGALFSVNPLAVKRNIGILTENKRVITPLQSDIFGKVLFIEVGATHVGTIHQTYQPHKQYLRGEEKGYFSFGGSALILLFPKNSIIFDRDLLEASEQHIETRCLLGQSMGQSIQ